MASALSDPSVKNSLSPGTKDTTSDTASAGAATAIAATGTRSTTADFSFGRWIRLYGVDLITMGCMGVIGLGVYDLEPAPSRRFVPSFPSYMYELLTTTDRVDLL